MNKARFIKPRNLHCKVAGHRLQATAGMLPKSMQSGTGVELVAWMRRCACLEDGVDGKADVRSLEDVLASPSSKE